MTVGPIGPVSRRALLSTGGRTAMAATALGGLPGILAACGGDDSDDSGNGGAPGGLTRADIENATGTVRALVWEGYDAASIYEGLAGVKIKPGYLTQNEDVLTKLRVGDRAQFTLTTIFQGYIDPLLALDAIVPLEPKLLSNFSGLFARFQEEEAMRRNGKLYSVPFLWGTMQVNYNADETDEPTSFDDLMDPSLKGRIGLNDDLYSSITQFARFAGAENPNHLAKEELDETMELLRKFRPQVASIQPGSELTGLLARGEVAVATPDWAPSIVEARKAGLDVKSTMPALTFIDGWLMVRAGADEAAAYKLIDAAISEDAQVTAGTDLGLGVVNEVAASALPEDIRSAWPYDDVGSLLDEAPAYAGVPIESDEFATLQDWVKAWEQFKAS